MRLTRQQMRRDCWTEAQKKWRVMRADDGKLYPADDRGVMPRKVRRSIAHEIFRKAFKEARKVQLEIQAKQEHH